MPHLIKIISLGDLLSEILKNIIEKDPNINLKDKKLELKNIIEIYENRIGGNKIDLNKQYRFCFDIIEQQIKKEEEII